MGVSKNRPAHKAKAQKRQNTIIKKVQKDLKTMAEQKKEVEQPIMYTYHKDRESVEIPIKAWQMINQAAKFFQEIATFVAVTEQLGQQHITDGVLLPAYKDDFEAIPGKVNADGKQQFQLKESFWNKGKSLIEMLGKPTIILADGEEAYREKPTTAIN